MTLPVSLVPCADYDAARVFEAVRRAVELVGGMGRFVKAGDRVLLKANLTSTRIAVSCTHPSVAGALARLAREAGGEVVIADSIPDHLHGLWQKLWRRLETSLAGRDYASCSAFLEKVQALEDPHRAVDLRFPGSSAPVITPADLGSEELDRELFSRVGYLDAAEAAGARCVALDREGRTERENNGGVYLKSILLTDLLAWSTVVLDVPRLKTHNLMRYTGAIKNCFGLVPGNRRPRYHELSRLAGSMGEMFVDIFSVVKPALSVMDGVIGMEGDGPIDGQTREIGLIAASADAVALDAVCGSVIGFAPRDVDTTRIAGERGLGEADLSKIPVLGGAVCDFRVDDFKSPPDEPPDRRRPHRH
jgi:uncharacterized protein (DUF362 family)